MMIVMMKMRRLPAKLNLYIFVNMYISKRIFAKRLSVCSFVTLYTNLHNVAQNEPNDPTHKIQ